MTQAAIDIIVDPEFRQLIPPLTPDERAQLEANLLADGCRDALVVWAGENILLDGHNRLDICQAHGIEFDVYELEMADRDEAMLWISENQLGRRNLKPDQLVAVAYVVQMLRSEIAKRLRAVKGGLTGGIGRPKNSLEADVSTKLSDEPTERTRAAVAKEFGISERKLRHAAELHKKAPEKLEKVRSGELQLSQAIREVRKDERTSVVTEWPTGKYAVIYADPPWSYNDKLGGDISDMYGAAEKHYPCMSMSELMGLDVHLLAADNCVLWLWSTCPMLPEALDLARAWGFKYKAQFVWDKVKHNMGHYNSVRHEILLICTRGNMVPEVAKLHDSVQVIERTEHSRKPEAFRAIIDELYPSGPRIELFARGKAYGWDVYGNDIN
jgi:N6-adenosine-specific RNA methylase IME4